MIARAAPANVHELLARAVALEGLRLEDIEAGASEPEASGSPVALSVGIGNSAVPSLRTAKGKAGDLLERALGAVGGNFKGPDFPALGVELKTLPVDLAGRSRESTFVCSLSFRDAEKLDFEASPLFAKLRHVLWIPIVIGDGKRRIGRAFAWRPTSEQLAVLRGDYDDLVGMIAIGKIESLTARFGRWLQVRPKGAHGRIRTRSFNEDGEPLWTMPRGFYLRARFTTALLRASSPAEL